MIGQPTAGTTVSRRTFFAATIAGGVALAACGSPRTATKTTDPIAAAEAARPHTGRTPGELLLPC